MKASRTSAFRVAAAVLLLAIFVCTAEAKRDIKCETCQTMMYHLAKGVESPKSKYHGARDVLVMELLEGLCGYGSLPGYARKAGIESWEMEQECKKIMEEYDLEEDLEEALGKTKEEDLRKRFCLKTGACDALWAEGDLPHERPDPAEVNLKAGKAFLEENAKKDGVVVLESGLQYKVLQEGTGTIKPGPQDQVSVHYRGTTIDGEEFDASRGEPVTFGVGGVISGWTEALQLMTRGAKWEVYIPSHLAYGEAGSGPKIGPNSALVFEVELVAIVGRDDASTDEAEEAGKIEL